MPSPPSARPFVGPTMRRLLLVSSIFPSDFETAVYGAQQRLRMFLESAAAVADALDVLFFVEPYYLRDHDPTQFAAELRARWGVAANVRFAARSTRSRSRWLATFGPVWSIRHHPEAYKVTGAEQVSAVRDALRPDTDLVFAFQIEAAQPVLAQRDLPPLALDLNDILHLRARRALARPGASRIEWLWLPMQKRADRGAVSRASVAFVCSEVARAYLAKMAPAGRVVVAANAVRWPRVALERPSTPPRVLLFVGLYLYDPNREAAEWLVRDLFPRVLVAAPDARLVLVGGGIERLAALRDVTPNVEFAGFVPDIAEAYRNSAVALAPILAGGGTRTKLIEAAAYRVPIVSTTLGAEGLDFVDGREILLRDEPQAFADACVALLDDPARAAAIADAACRRAATYDRDRVQPEIERALVEAAAGRDPRA